MLNFIFYLASKSPQIAYEIFKRHSATAYTTIFRTHPDIANPQNRVIPNHKSFNFPYKLQNVNKKLHNSASEQSFTHLVIIFLVFRKCTQRVLAVIPPVYVFAICRTYLQTGHYYVIITASVQR
jgi:hypothetical protein